ncbi:CBS domain-containing protein [Candidatus Pyrohabitans sp.]
MQRVLRDTKVRDVMTRGVITVKYYEPIKEVLAVMVKSDVSAVVVVDEQNEAMGVISTVDVLKELRNRSEKEVEKMEAEELMTPFTVSISPESSLQEAAELMIEKRIHRLVVLHGGHIAGEVPVGILSATDVLRVLNENL